MKENYKSEPFPSKRKAIEELSKMPYVRKVSKDKWKNKSGTTLYVNSLYQIVYNFGK